MGLSGDEITSIRDSKNEPLGEAPLTVSVDASWEDVLEVVDNVVASLKNGTCSFSLTMAPYIICEYSNLHSLVLREQNAAGLVTATANAMAASASAGLEGVAVSGARFFLDTLNMEQFTRDVVIRMVQLQHDEQAGRLNLAAVNAGEFSLITRLSAALLCNGCAKEAAAVSKAFWEVANATDSDALPVPISPSTIASTMAPAIVTAVDAGHAKTVAEVQRLLIRKYQCHLLVVGLTYAVASIENRPDAVSKGTLAALSLPGGEALASSIAALTMVEGHFEVAAKVAGLMYQDAKKKYEKQYVDEKSGKLLTNSVTTVIADAASQSIGIGQIQPVIKVTELLFEQQNGELAAGAVLTMLSRWEVKAIATVTIQALHQGKRQLVVQLIREMMAQIRHLGIILCLAYVIIEFTKLMYRLFR